MKHVRFRYFRIDWHLNDSICHEGHGEGIYVILIVIGIEFRFTIEISQVIFIYRQWWLFGKLKDHTPRAEMNGSLWNSVHVWSEIEKVGFSEEILDIMFTFLQKKQIEFLMRLS